MFDHDAWRAELRRDNRRWAVGICAVMMGAFALGYGIGTAWPLQACAPVQVALPLK